MLVWQKKIEVLAKDLLILVNISTAMFCYSVLPQDLT